MNDAPAVIVEQSAAPESEAIAASADAAVAIAEIQADAQVAQAEIAADVAIAAIEADTEQDREDDLWLQSALEGLSARLDALTADLQAHRQATETLLALLTVENLTALLSMIPSQNSVEPNPAMEQNPADSLPSEADGQKANQEATEAENRPAKRTRSWL